MSKSGSVQANANKKAETIIEVKGYIPLTENKTWELKSLHTLFRQHHVNDVSIILNGSNNTPPPQKKMF